MAYNIENFDFDAHIDRVIALRDQVKPGVVTIITGPNGYGKSLLRKLLSTIEVDGKVVKCASISMERRTSPNNDFGALRSIAIDRADDATSNNSFYLIECLLKEKDRYYILDESEIGMGKEVLLGVLQYIEADIAEKKANGKFYGMLVITHSEFLIENFKHDNFLNMEGMTYDEWKNREIKPVDPKTLGVWCLELWSAIEKRIKEKNKN
jgi:hypothetical protein